MGTELAGLIRADLAALTNDASRLAVAPSIDLGQPNLNNATGNTVTGNVVGAVGATQIYREVAAASPMASQACSLVGGNQPHDNMQPYLCYNFIISLFGVYPSQN